MVKYAKKGKKEGGLAAPESASFTYKNNNIFIDFFDRYHD